MKIIAIGIPCIAVINQCSILVAPDQSVVSPSCSVAPESDGPDSLLDLPGGKLAHAQLRGLSLCQLRQTSEEHPRQYDRADQTRGLPPWRGRVARSDCFEAQESIIAQEGEPPVGSGSRDQADATRRPRKGRRGAAKFTQFLTHFHMLKI